MLQKGTFFNCSLQCKFLKVQIMKSNPWHINFYTILKDRNLGFFGGQSSKSAKNSSKLFNAKSCLHANIKSNCNFCQSIKSYFFLYVWNWIIFFNYKFENAESFVNCSRSTKRSETHWHWPLFTAFKKKCDKSKLKDFHL